MRGRFVLAALLAASCGGGDETPPSTQCTKAVYDPCLTEHDCASGRCQNFAGGLLVCTMTCTPNSAECPALDGMAASCTADGVCQPPRARDCELAP